VNNLRTDHTHFSDAEAMLTLLLSGSEEMFFLVDRNLAIRYYNDTAKESIQKLLNLTLEPGLSMLRLAQSTERVAYFRHIYLTVLNGATHEGEEEFFNDGKLKTYQYRIRPAKKDKGEISAAIVTVYDVTEKRATENALKQSEERLRFALESSNHGIWDWNIETGEIYFSPSWRAMLGFDEEEIENNISEWESRIHPEDKAQLTLDIFTHFHSVQPTYENTYRLRAKDNSYRWIEGRGNIIEYAPDGRPLRMIGTHTDITEKRDSEVQYRNLFESNPLPTWIYDFDTFRFLAVNCAAINHYGYSREEFLKMTIPEIFPVKYRDLLNEALHTRDSHPKSNYTNWKHQKKNGEIIVVDVNATTISYTGRKARLIVVNDITEKAVAEEELRKSNERFQYVSKATSDAIYDMDFLTGDLTWGEGITTLFGHAPDEVTMQQWEACIHPDDRLATTTCLYKTIYNTCEKIWKKEYRFKKSDGAYRYVIEKGFILRDSENKPLRMIGAMQDITELKQKQVELLESNKRYEYATLAVSDIIWDWDLQKDCVLWSDNYEKLTGWKLPADKCLPVATCVERFHESDREYILKSMRDVSQNKKDNTWSTELRYVKACGETAFVYNRGYVLRDEAGNAVRMIGAMQDITHRKKLEEQLLQKELEKQRSISKATIETQERERTEIGRELHDNVNQVLTTTKLYLELALSNAVQKDDLLQKSQNNIMYVINEIRQLSRSLMNPSLGDLGLIASLTDLAENIRVTRRLHVVLEADETIEDMLPDNLGLTIYRITQEALNNAVKHAQATRVIVGLYKSVNGIELIVQDNGTGFDPDQIKQGSGLKSIKNRTYLTNGTLQIMSAPGAGCTLTVTFIM
jgi:PAS domain S-box-containing protein